MSVNVVCLSGNLVRDAQVRSTASGSAVCNFTVAVNDRQRNRQTGEWEDRADFVDCVLFGTRADKLAQYLTKGAKAFISGKLRYSSWEKDGQRRSKLEVVVDEIEFSSRERRQEQQRPAMSSDIYGEEVPF